MRRRKQPVQAAVSRWGTRQQQAWPPHAPAAHMDCSDVMALHDDGMEPVTLLPETDLRGGASVCQVEANRRSRPHDVCNAGKRTWHCMNAPASACCDDEGVEGATVAAAMGVPLQPDMCLQYSCRPCSEAAACKLLLASLHSAGAAAAQLAAQVVQQHSQCLKTAQA